MNVAKVLGRLREVCCPISEVVQDADLGSPEWQLQDGVRVGPRGRSAFVYEAKDVLAGRRFPDAQKGLR